MSVCYFIGRFQIPTRFFSSSSNPLFRSKKLDSISSPLPPPPKKPVGVFMRYVMYLKHKFANQNISKPHGEVLKYAAIKWKNEDVETRARFQRSYYKDLGQYEQDNINYYLNLNEKQKQYLVNYPKKKQVEELEKRINEYKPKKPPNGFSLFIKSRKDELPHNNGKDFLPRLAEHWKNLPPEKKVMFREEAKLRQAKYFEELKDWKKRVDPALLEELENLNKDEEITDDVS